MPNHGLLQKPMEPGVELLGGAPPYTVRVWGTDGQEVFREVYDDLAQAHQAFDAFLLWQAVKAESPGSSLEECAAAVALKSEENRVSHQSDLEVLRCFSVADVVDFLREAAAEAQPSGDELGQEEQEQAEQAEQAEQRDQAEQAEMEDGAEEAETGALGQQPAGALTPPAGRPMRKKHNAAPKGRAAAPPAPPGAAAGWQLAWIAALPNAWLLGIDCPWPIDCPLSYPQALRARGWRPQQAASASGSRQQGPPR